MHEKNLYDFETEIDADSDNYSNPETANMMMRQGNEKKIEYVVRCFFLEFTSFRSCSH